MGSRSELISSIWEEIEYSERYLVCCMYEKAASLALHVLRQIRNHDNIEYECDYDVQEESAGMVLVQSMYQLGRVSEILSELKGLFISVADIPVEVLLTCYLEVVEVYAMVLLQTPLKNIDLAISRVERASLPEDRCEELLRRLHSIYSVRTTNVSQSSSLLLPADNHNICSSPKEANASNGSLKALKSNGLFDGLNNKKQTILTLSKLVEPCFWWFRHITLKFGNDWLVVSNGKIMICCLIFLVFYVFQRKQANLKRIVPAQASSVNKALLYLWHLAFSYQVNPLAAVQPLPPATRGNH